MSMASGATTRTSLPVPAPGTVRRTVSLEVTPLQDWSDGLRVSAFGRDLLVAAGPGRSRVLRAAAMTVTIDGASRVTGIESALPAAVTAPLTGAPAVSGFRARLSGLAGLDPSSVESALLDELPTVRLVSGYAQLMELPAGTTRLPAQRRGRSPMIGICAGWAPGGTADLRDLTGAPVVTGTPPAPAIETMTPYFHAETALRPRSMRRRRILDVSRRAGGYEVFAYFRDSHIDVHGREGALHEYEVHAQAAADEGCTLEHIDVTPHALPFDECPLAAASAPSLEGAPLRDVAATVREQLAGTRSCTHLNDTLRFLRYVPALADPSKNPEGR
jgi:Protein of unknown function (DUF2889)